MTRTHLRATFAAGIVAGAAALAAGTAVALVPKPYAVGQPSDVAIASVAALDDRLPELVVVPELKGLDVEARSLRLLPGGLTPMGARAPRAGDLAIFVVKSDGTVRAFIALDPRNGCALKLEISSVTLPNLRNWGTAFLDVCHGSLYDVTGHRIGGPSPWDLDELVISVRDGIVYADRRKVLPGRLVLP